MIAIMLIYVALIVKSSIKNRDQSKKKLHIFYKMSNP